MKQHLDESSLAQRWGISRRTLQRWRQIKTGPAYLRLGGRIVYAIADVVAFETVSRMETSSSGPLQGEELE